MEEDNDKLTKNQEIKDIVFSLAHNKIQGMMVSQENLLVLLG